MRHSTLTATWICRELLVLVACATALFALSPPSLSQTRGLSPDKIQDLIKRVRQGNFEPLELVQLAESGAPEATPVLKEQFALNTTPIFVKQHIAYSLVQMGEKDQTYWKFLFSQAQAAAENDAPFPHSFDSQGRSVPGQLAPQFIEWARVHNLSPSDAASDQIYSVPGALILLAKTGDPRGRELLRRGLLSQNYVIQAMAARGLAKLQDKGSIPLIIQACQKAPQEPAEVIAWALVFFDDPQAQSAAEKFIKNKQGLEGLRKLRVEKGIDGIL